MSTVPVVAVLPGDRPDPPAELAEKEAAQWRSYVERMPPGWFPLETWPLLMELCRMVCLTARLSRELEAFESRSLEDVKTYARFQQLLRMKMGLAGHVGALSAKLRV